MTEPFKFVKQAQTVKNTWGKHCNKLVFFSTKDDHTLPAIKVDGVPSGRANLWGITQGAFKYIWEYFRDEADWFLKADDDTFVIVENLRMLLQSYNASDPIYFGRRFQIADVAQGYMSGGAGYVLSREAVRRFAEAKPSSDCKKDTIEGVEDVLLGQCMQVLGVKAGDSRDSLGRERFFSLDPSYHSLPETYPRPALPQWYSVYKYYPETEVRVKLSLEFCDVIVQSPSRRRHKLPLKPLVFGNKHGIFSCNLSENFKKNPDFGWDFGKQTKKHPFSATSTANNVTSARNFVLL